MDPLISKLKEGRNDFLALVAEVRPDLHRYCARMTGSITDGEDVVQETLARAFYALPTVLPVPALRPWLFTIAHNCASDYLRRHERKKTESLDDADPADPAPTAEELIAQNEAVQAAISAFAELPASQRSAVILKDVLGESLDEIATLLSTSVPAVKAALHRGRARLAARPAAPAPPRQVSATLTR